MTTSKSHFTKCGSPWKIWIIVLQVMSFWLPITEPAAVALTQYAMDQKSDCLTAGFLDIPRGQVTKLTAPSKDQTTITQTLNCRLLFSPQTEGDTLKMTMTSGSQFEDCDVKLELQMTNYEKILRDCRAGAGSVPVLQAVNGQASIWLSRGTYDDKSYWFEITLTAVRSEVQDSQSKDNTSNVGLIVGVTLGVIVLIIVVIICVCCYLHRRGSEREQTKNSYNNGVVKDSLFANSGHGYENNMAKISYDDSFHKSPQSDRKLLNQNSENVKPKSALERFGHPPSHRGQENLENRETDSVKRRERYEDRDFTKTRTHQEEKERGKPSDISVKKIVGSTPADVDSAPKSYLLTALQGNAKFRKSFHDNEVDAEERVRRISDRSSFTNSSSADSEILSVKRPKLPPVPKSPARSPSSQRKGEKIAGVYHSGLSSSSSEATRIESEDSEDRDEKILSRSKLSGEKIKKIEKKIKDVEDESDDRKRRGKDKKGENKLRKRHNNEDENRGKPEDSERRQKKERKARSVDEGDDGSQNTEREYEGRFKKSASGRKPKGKGQRMGRSRSVGNTLEELESNHHQTRSKSPSSVRSFILAEDDEDDELDSNYTSFKRSGSKMSLYASRSSLYGRRRKNSMGETVSMSSYMYDDVDSRIGDFDKTGLSHKEKERLFKSTGDLDFSSASALVCRECATQTGGTKEVYVFGRKTIAKGRSGKRYSRGTQTNLNKERRDSIGSTRSGTSARSNRLKSRSKSQESLRKHKSSRSRDSRDDDNASVRSHPRRHVKHPDRNYSESEDDDSYSGKKGRHRSKSIEIDSDHSRPKQRSKPKPMSRKLQSTASSNISDSDDDKSAVTGTSITAPSSIHQMTQQIAPMPHFAPTGYPFAYPQAVAYVPTAPGGPPVMFPVTSVPQSNMQKKPSIPPKPNASKWDQLVNLTEGMKKRRHQMGESLETESVMSSAWSQPMTYGYQPQPHYYQSAYTMPQRIPDSDSAYGLTYPESMGMKQPREQNIEYKSYRPTDSNV